MGIVNKHSISSNVMACFAGSRANLNDHEDLRPFLFGSINNTTLFD